MNATPDFPYDKFRCLRCGRCCSWHGFVRVSGEEIDAIADALGMTAEDFIREKTILHPDRSCLSIAETPDGVCVLYDDANKCCLVNAVKPQQCRNFPSVWNFPGWETVCEGAIDLCSREREP